MVRNTLRSAGFFLGVLVLLSTVLWTIGLWTTGADVYAQTDVLFRRGDGNHDGSVNVSDPIFLLGCQFRGTECSACEDAADANDDRRVDVSDTVYLFLWFFEGGGAPPLPGAFECGLDPSDDSLAKCVYPICDPTGVTRVDVSPTQFDFGERMRGTTALGSVLVSNTGDAPVTLTGASTSAPFTVEELTGLSILNPGETLQLTIEFTPSTAGSFQRVLTVSFGDVDDIEATLSGTGTDSTPPPPDWQAGIDRVTTAIRNDRRRRMATGGGFSGGRENEISEP